MSKVYVSAIFLAIGFVLILFISWFNPSAAVKTTNDLIEVGKKTIVPPTKDDDNVDEHKKIVEDNHLPVEPMIFGKELSPLGRTFSLSGFGHSAPEIMDDFASYLELTPKQRAVVNAASSTLMTSLQHREAEVAVREDTPEGEVVVIPEFEGTDLLEAFHGAVSNAVPAYKAKLITEVVTVTPVFRELGKHPTKLYFEEQSDESFRLKIENRRSNLSMESEPSTMVIDGREIPVVTRPYDTITTIAYPESAIYGRYREVLEKFK